MLKPKAADHKVNSKPDSQLLTWFAAVFWMPWVFTTPMIVVLNNPTDFPVSVPGFIAVTALSLLLLVLLSVWIIKRLPSSIQYWLALSLVAAGTVFALQGNVVHSLFYYGEFNGAPVNWQDYGAKYYLEMAGFIGAFPLVLLIFRRLRHISAWVPALVVISSLISLAEAVVVRSDPDAVTSADLGAEIDPSVFEFSSEKNLIHLVVDGLQGDIVRQVFDEQPELSSTFDGFIMFTNHTGQFQNTGPSVITMLTGHTYDLKQGFSRRQTRKKLAQYGYAETLADNGFQIDNILPSPSNCIKRSDSCVSRTFNDLKARGYYPYSGERWFINLGLLSDLVLFRHFPLALKVGIYNDGNWFFSNNSLDGTHPIPYPVIKEWTDHLKVMGAKPRYKLHHFIGTHVPPHWDENCVRSSAKERTRKNFKAQTVCVLKGIAEFLKKLKAAKIYDNTAMMITGDHGCNVPPDDMSGESRNYLYFQPEFFGNARPALMVKAMMATGPLEVSSRATTITDIAPTALELAGLTGDYAGSSVLSQSEQKSQIRKFQRYAGKDLWKGKPIPYAQYSLTGDVKQKDNWQLADIFSPSQAPTGFQRINQETADSFFRGLILTSSGSPVGARIAGNEFGFLVARPPTGTTTLDLSLQMINKKTPWPEISVWINGHSIANDQPIQSSKGEWTIPNLVIDEQLFDRRNNFVRVYFTPGETASAWTPASPIRLGAVTFDDKVIP